MIPTALEGWNLDVIKGLLAQGVFESDLFDFKEKLPHKSDQEEKARLAKACCAFANSEGGFLIFGVKDDNGLSSIDRLVGLDPGEDFPEHFGNYPAKGEPSVEWAFRNPPLVLGSDRLIHVVHVPASHRKPHGYPDQGRWWVCKRTSKGTESMSFDEIRQAFLETSRRMGSLSWLKTEVTRIHELAQYLNIEIQKDRVTLEPLLSRFSIGQVRTLALTLHEDLNNGSSLVTDLQSLVADCDKVDSVLVPLSNHVILSRTQSYARAGNDPLRGIVNTVINVIHAAYRIRNELIRVLQ